MCFSVQIFLNELSNKNNQEFKVIILDNGAFSKRKFINYSPAKTFHLFFFLHFPQNSTELAWLNVKRKTTFKIYKTIVGLKLDEIVKAIITESL